MVMWRKKWRWLEACLHVSETLSLHVSETLMVRSNLMAEADMDILATAMLYASNGYPSHCWQSSMTCHWLTQHHQDTNSHSKTLVRPATLQLLALKPMQARKGVLVSRPPTGAWKLSNMVPAAVPEGKGSCRHNREQEWRVDIRKHVNKSAVSH